MNRWTLHACALLALAAAAPAATAGPDEETRKLIESLRLEEAPEPVSASPVWRRPERVHIVIPARAEQDRERLLAEAREVAPGVELVPLSGGSPDPGVIAEAEVLLGYCSVDLIRNARKLRWLQHYGSGVNHCMYPGIEKKEFIFTNNQHSSAPPIAEHVIAMMMMLTRGLHVYHRAQAEGRWLDERTPMQEISGKTLLIAGLGGIGTEVAWRAHALGMRVIATRNSSREGPEFVEYVGLSHELPDLAAQADVVVNALPLTEETKGLFDAKFFDTVKRGALFISVGRGASTVTGDLVAALKDGRLSGAGLDVTEPEPLPAGHELWTLPNVVITPHVAATTDRGFERGWLIIRENLRRYVNGEKLLNVVDVKR
ncbi:MAG TPA: D-2-hydroxyacid dehydrogenase, partial [Gemmatimonadales bacterium]|nr:D-2-hydroxyacid dehydrogenase [Gemmatimonadales bacterium]